MSESVNNCKCEGFAESSVLAVKSIFTSRDIKELLIVKDDGRIVYHSRDCNDCVDVDNKANISSQCKQWFNITLVKVQDIKMNAENPEIELNSFHKDYTLTKVNKGLSVKKKALLHIQGESILKLKTHGHDYYAKGDTEQEETPADYDVIDASAENDVLDLAYTKDEIVDDLSVEEGNECLEKSREKSSCKKSTKIRKLLRNKNSKTKSQKLKENQMTSSSKEQKCPVCNKVFAKKGNLTRHQRTHTGETKECTVCNQKVKDLTKHMRCKHTDKDRLCYFCDICGRGFKDSGAYSYHKSGHTGDRNYSCSTCNKQYRNSSEQKKCERGHLGIFKYSCTSCGYRTHQKNKFTRHSRIHSKEAPFICPICFLSLARKDYLQKHLMKKHGDYKLLDLEHKFPTMYQAKDITEPSTQQILHETSFPSLNKDVTVYVISS